MEAECRTPGGPQRRQRDLVSLDLCRHIRTVSNTIVVHFSPMDIHRAPYRCVSIADTGSKCCNNGMYAMLAVTEQPPFNQLKIFEEEMRPHTAETI